MAQIFTVGYSAGWTPESLLSFLVKEDAILIDVRFNPSSRMAEWRQGPLSRVMGERYLHLKGLGNENYKGGPIKLHDPQAAADRVAELLASGKSVALLCVCGSPDRCHRRDAAQFCASRFDAEITHVRSPREVPHG